MDNATLAMMRRTVQAYMASPILILDPTSTADRYGKTTTTYSPAGSYSGQLSSVTGQEQRLLNGLVDGGIERRETAKLKLPWGTAITAAQVVQTADGKRWNIAHVATLETLGAAVVVLLTFREVVPSER